MISAVGPPLVIYATITRNTEPLYKAATKPIGSACGWPGSRSEGRGREHLQPGQTYIFMSNHVSNLDPPVLIPVFPDAARRW